MAKSRKKTKSASKSPGLVSDIKTIISYSFAGKLLLSLIIGGLVVLVAMIASGNQYDMFFRITGISVLLITLLSLILYLARKK